MAVWVARYRLGAGLPSFITGFRGCDEVRSLQGVYIWNTVPREPCAFVCRLVAVSTRGDAPSRLPEFRNTKRTSAQNWVARLGNAVKLVYSTVYRMYWTLLNSPFFSLTVVISYVLTRTINSCDHPDILPRNEIKTKT